MFETVHNGELGPCHRSGILPTGSYDAEGNSPSFPSPCRPDGGLKQISLRFLLLFGEAAPVPLCHRQREVSLLLLRQIQSSMKIMTVDAIQSQSWFIYYLDKIAHFLGYAGGDDASD